MTTRTSQLQIRVTAQQKALLRRRARAAGLGMSEYVLTLALPPLNDQFGALVRELATAEDPRAILAELNELLAEVPASEFGAAVAHPHLSGLSPYLANYVAAMVEQAAHLKRADPPDWVQDVVPLEAPHFVTPLRSLRLHLLRHAPVPFKRRNIFIDASVGARV